jgi:hypothetical protein
MMVLRVPRKNANSLSGKAATFVNSAKHRESSTGATKR